MDVVKEDSRFLWCLCHGESEPSLCINKAEFNGRPKGYYYCHGCGKWGNVSPEWVDSVSVKRTICRQSENIDWNKLNKLYQLTDLTERKSERLAKEWNVNCLPQYGVGWDGEAWTFPMMNEEGDIAGIMRRFPNGDKICVHGSHLGIFVPDSARLFPLNETVVICEGLSDAAVATTCGFFGLGLPSACFGEKIIKKYLTSINYCGTIVIVPDGDKAGRLSRDKLLKELGEARVVEVESDLKSFYLEHGKEETVRRLK